MVFAAAAMLIAACGKDEATDSAVTPKPHTDYLICDGVAHPFVKETALGENGFYQVYLSPASPGDDFRVELLMKQEDVGKNFDLTTDHAGDYSIDVRLANGHRIRIGTVTPVDSIRYLPYCGSNVD